MFEKSAKAINAQMPQLRLESDCLDDYLSCSEIIDWRTPAILELVAERTSGMASEVDKAKCLFEWVRDNIAHSCDAHHENVTCRASEVLRYRTGLCFAKSHLLVALLRASDIPAGFCYQRLRLREDSARMTLHGFCGFYLKSLARWFRVDSRGNKAGVDAQFSLDREQLAFSTNPALGEVLYPNIFVEPLACVVKCLAMYESVSEVLEQLPDSL